LAKCPLMTPIGSRLLGIGASRMAPFDRPPLANIGTIRWVGRLVGRQSGWRRRSRSRRVSCRYPLAPCHLSWTRRRVVFGARGAIPIFPDEAGDLPFDTDVRSSHVVPCVALIAVSPGTVHWHEGAARSAGTLDRQLTFSSPAAYSCDVNRGQSQGDSHLALSLRGVRIRH